MKFVKSILVIASLSIMFSASAQQQFAQFKQVNDGKFSYTYIENDPANARFYTLPNGLTVILAQNTEKPVIQTLIATKAGSKNDPATNTGLAHYLEHLLFKGTDKYGTIDYATEIIYLNKIDSLYSVYNKTTNDTERKAIYRAIDSISQIAAGYAIPNEYDKLMQVIGASGTNAFTSFEQTVYVNQIPANEIDRWLEIESERFRNPVFRIFHTELEAVYEEKNISLDNDQNKVFETLFAKLFQNHTYGTQTTIGTVEHLKNPSLQAIRDYYHTYYVPNNMAIIMVGDLDFDKTIQAILDRFSYMQAKPIPVFTFNPEPIHNSPTVAEITGPTAEMVVLGYRFPGDGTKEADLLRMMDLVLSNSAAGLIDLNLNKSQKVLGAGSSPEILKDYSVHYFYAMPKEGQSLEEVKNLILSQIQAVQDGNFDENLMKGIIFNQEVDDIKNFEDNQGTAYTLLDAFIKNLQWNEVLNINYRMSKITKQELMDFAKKYYTNDYVIIYKRQGTAENVTKIEKPQITKIPVNRDKTSNFVQQIASKSTSPIEPKFPDFNKDMQQGNLGIASYFYIPNKRNELFTLYYVIDAGTYSNKELSLALDYLEYMGTDKYTPEEISEKFYSLGCSYGVSASNRQSYVYLSGLQQNFEQALALFEHLLTNMKADEIALADLKGRLLKSRENSKSNKNAIRTALNYYALYGADNPQRFVLKNKEINKIKSKTLIKSIKGLLQTKHDIVYYGPGASVDVLNIISKYHHLPKKFAKSPKMKEFTPLQQVEPTVYFSHYNMVQAEITWQKPTHPFNQALLPQIAMFNEYFGGGMSSIVFQEIRESQALAYSTYAYYAQPMLPKEIGRMFAYVGTQSDKMPAAIHSMNELIHNMPQNQSSFDQAKNSLDNNIRTSRTTKTGIYFAWRTVQLLNLPKTTNELLFDKINTVTMADVVNFQESYVKQGNYTLSILADESKVTQEELKKYGKVITLSLDELFGY